MQVQWWKQRGFVAAAAFLLGVAALFGVTRLAGEGEGGEGSSAVVKSRTPAETPQGGCRVPAGDQAIPLRAPGARWEAIGEQKAPAASSAGPGLRDGAHRRCFAHSARGSVFAAYNASAQFSTYGDRPDVLREITAAGQARDEALRHGSPSSAGQDLIAEPVGFRVLDYAAESATVALAYRMRPRASAELDPGRSITGLVAITYRMLWQQGDWRVVLQPGSDSLEAEAVPSLAGFVKWGAS